MTSPVLVDREQELRRVLQAALRPPSMLVIEGEAGVGKSRLVQEALRQPELKGLTTLAGRCHPFREPLSVAPLVDALRTLGRPHRSDRLSPVAGALRRVLPEWADELPPAPSPSGDAAAERHLLFRAVTEVLALLGPAVCIIEDIHWSDEGTTEFLRWFVAELPDTLSLILTFRREDVSPASPLLGLTRVRGGRAHVETLSLAPLGVAGVGAMAGRILGGEPVSEEFAAYLHERTSGLPFALEEVIWLIQDRHDIVRRPDGRWIRRGLDELEVPSAVRDAVVERLAGLSADARRVLETIAVLGMPAPESLVAQVAGITLTRTERALSEALACAVLAVFEEETYGFRHGLGRQAVYEAIPRPARRRLHLKAAQALELANPQPIGQLAWHFREADQRARWVQCAEIAADLAVLQSESRTAVWYMREALSTPGLMPIERARLAFKLGRAAATGLVELESSIAFLKDFLRQESLLPEWRGELQDVLGSALIAVGETSAGRAAKTLAVDALAETQPGVAAHLMTSLADPWTLDGSMVDHMQSLERAALLAAREIDEGMRAHVVDERERILLCVGDPTAWERIGEVLQAEPRAGSGQRGFLSYSGLWSAAFHVGHYGWAQAALQRAIQKVADAEDATMAHPILDIASALNRWATGDWQNLDAEVRAIAAELARTGTEVPWFTVPCQSLFGWLAIAHGDIADASRSLRIALDGATAAGMVPGVASAWGGMARIDLLRGRPEAAAENAGRGVDLIAAKGIWAWSGEVIGPTVEAMIACGNLKEAIALTKMVAAGLEHREAPLARAALALCNGLVAEAAHSMKAAEKAFAAAERSYTSLPRPYDAAGARLRLGLCRLAAGGTGGGDDVLAALGCFQALGATADEARARQSLRAHSISVPSTFRGGRQGYGERLSPQEARVAEMAAEGRTNRDIARAIFLSSKTVEHHVAAAVRKLGKRSKRELLGTWPPPPEKLPPQN